MNPKTFLDLAKSFGGGRGNVVELPAPQGPYDRILNAINRTGRPILLVSAIAFFWWGIANPSYFVTVMKAFATTPEWISTAVLMTIGIFGTGRIISDVKKKHTVMQEVSKPDEEPQPELSERPSITVNVERRFANLDDEREEVMEEAEEILNAEPENEAIAQWKAKNAAS